MCPYEIVQLADLDLLRQYHLQVNTDVGLQES